MTAVKFLEERKRMYESGAATPSIGLEDDYNPVNAVKIVETALTVPYATLLIALCLPKNDLKKKRRKLCGESKRGLPRTRARHGRMCFWSNIRRHS